MVGDGSRRRGDCILKVAVEQCKALDNRIFRDRKAFNRRRAYPLVSYPMRALHCSSYCHIDFEIRMLVSNIHYMTLKCKRQLWRCRKEPIRLPDETKSMLN
jgi:hypothetical protein